VIALAVTQNATVRKNSAFWHDKGGEGGVEWYKYDEDEEQELPEDPDAPDYRHTLGIEPKTWLSTIHQEVMHYRCLDAPPTSPRRFWFFKSIESTVSSKKRRKICFDAFKSVKTMDFHRILDIKSVPCPFLIIYSNVDNVILVPK
jgi:hypothetical protein